MGRRGNHGGNRRRPRGNTDKHSFGSHLCPLAYLTPRKVPSPFCLTRLHKSGVAKHQPWWVTIWCTR